MAEGIFTGHKLSNYLNDSHKDYLHARKIINGSDRAGIIKHYAKEFEECLLKSK